LWGHPFLNGPIQNAADRRNADATCKKYRRPGKVLMQGKRSSRTAHFELGPKGSGHQSSFKTSLPHAHRDHDQAFVVRRVCERKGTRVVAFVSNGWAQEGKVGVLAGSEVIIAPIRVKPKRHRASGDSLAIH